MSASDRHCTTVASSGHLGSQDNNLLPAIIHFLKGLASTLFVVCLPLFSTSAQAPTLIIPVDSTLSQNTLTNCDTVGFISDSTTPLLYVDTTARMDTLSICPQSQNQSVEVRFTAFDVASGDSLLAYDSKTPADSTLIGKASGTGISVAFGSWVKANCSPDSNATGCLSFVFKTNGDQQVGRGWAAKVNCREKNIALQSPSVTVMGSGCQPAHRMVTIPAALLTYDCDTIVNDTTFVRIRNSQGIICKDTCLSRRQNMQFTEVFAFGRYSVEYKWKLDTTISQQIFFGVQPPALVCNDTLNIGMGSHCSVQINPDILLESPCDTLQDTLYYEITISEINGSDKKQIIASGNGKAGDYPIITKEMVKFCGENIYRAEIKRLYYDSLTLDICNDGPQNNACWTYLRFEDKSAPLFELPVQCDTLYVCDVAMTPVALGLDTPKVKDNCDSVRVRYAGAEMLSIPTDCDTIQRYLIVWEATDECGNVGRRKDTVKIFRPGVDKIVKAPTAILSCGEDDSTAINDLQRLGVPGLKIGFQENGAFVATDTIPLTQNARICNYALEKRDVKIAVECNTKYYRYWYLLDWCSHSTVAVTIDTQLIEFRDTLPPALDCKGFTTLTTAEKINLPSNSCQLKVSFPLPTAKDKCVANPTVEEFTVDVLESGEWWRMAKNLLAAGALECDTFRVGYRAFDDCHSLLKDTLQQLRADTCYRYFILRDVTAPTAICTDELNVSVSRGVTYIHADAIDGGSWDMCEIDTILARRTVCNDVSTYKGDTSLLVFNKLGNRISPIGWSDTLGFECCDVHHPVIVELLVIDKKGNYNTCWMDVKVEDKIIPICQSLPADTAFCDEFDALSLGIETDLNSNNAFDEDEWLPLVGDLAMFYNQRFGDPATVCADNLDCNALMMEQEYQLHRQSCGEMTIRRRYRVIDYGKNQSVWEVQNINVVYRPNWTLTFPADQEGRCDSKLSIPTTSPIENGNCDQLSWEYEDEVFESATDVFTKVLRTYSIINWCTYEPGMPPLIVNRPENIQKLVKSPFSITSDSITNAGFIQYTQVLHVVDEEAPFLIMGKIDTIVLGKGDAAPAGEEDQTLGAFPYECDAIRIFQVFARDCNEAISENLRYEWQFLHNGAMMAEGTGDTFSQVVYPGPKYEVKWFVTDVFANTSLIAKTYNFVDGIKPTPYCLSSIASEFTPGNRFVYLDADMFDRGSYDNCTDQRNLEKRLWHPVLDIPRPTTTEEVLALPTHLELGCLFLGTQAISFYVVDEVGNFDYCNTQAVIQNNMLACSRRSVAGAIMDQKGSPIEEVKIAVESIEANLSIMSDDNGNFEFTMPEGAEYTIRPIKNDDPLNGVSTYDLVLISQHILGINEFDTPYKYLAADVNKSGSVTAFDIVQIRQLILNIVPEFHNNMSWRFVDMDHDFSSNEAAMQLESTHEEKTIRHLSGDRLGTDFLGVKIGDINGSALPNRSARAGKRSNRPTFTLKVDNQFLEKGKIYTVPFTANHFADISGYQFTLQFDYLNLLHIEGGVAKLEHFGRTFEDQGKLTTSWHSLQSREISTSLFTLTFQATKEGYLHELLKITSEHTPAEA
ncbi:MAG: hypothetical protein AAGJ18_10455, partial [Bacteroidota bacterium]